MAFDASYYGRYYASSRTRVHGPKEIGRLCTAVTGFFDWWDLPLKKVLDVGAGVGLWRDWFRANRPKVKYRSTEYSAYACEKFGHEQRDISRWRVKEQFDLVVCQGVLPYLDDAACARAIDNLGAMTRGMLYLESITKHDVEEIIDDVKTDTGIHARPGAWYRRRLARHYDEVGCGLWAKKDAPILFYELETPAKKR